MIPFNTWLSQIVGYCHFVADTSGVMQAWINADTSQTSVTDFDELYEQVFDDLDSDAVEKNLGSDLPTNPDMRKALTAFLAQLRVIGVLQERIRGSASMESLIESQEWARLVEVARLVIRVHR